VEEEFKRSEPVTYALIILRIVFLTGVVLIVYDWFVTNRQTHTEKKAEKSSAIVQELFPGNVAAKIFADSYPLLMSSQSSIVGDNGSLTLVKSSIADFYPAATILFADIAGA